MVFVVRGKKLNEKLMESEEKQQIRSVELERRFVVSRASLDRSGGSINDDCAIAIHCILIRDATLL